MVDIDFAPLHRQPTPAEVEQVRAEVIRGDLGKESQKIASGPSTGNVVGCLVGGVLVLVGAITTIVQAINGDGAEDIAVGLAFVGLGVVIGFIARFFGRRSDRAAWRRTTRLVAFARANGLDFQPWSEVPDLPGPLAPGHRTSTTNRMRWTARVLRAETAEHSRYSEGSGNTTTHYLAVHLGVDLPGMTFLSGRKGPPRATKRSGPDAFDGLPHSLTADAPDPRSQTLFDHKVITILADDEHPCDAEYANGWFVAYYRPDQPTRESRWRHALTLADAVAATRPALER